MSSSSNDNGSSSDFDSIHERILNENPDLRAKWERRQSEPLEEADSSSPATGPAQNPRPKV